MVKVHSELSMPRSQKHSNRDHAHQHQLSGTGQRVIAADFEALLTLRCLPNKRTSSNSMKNVFLNLSLMLAAVLTIFVAEVTQRLTRMLAQEDLLQSCVQVSQQAVNQRFLGFPSVLFERLFYGTATINAGSSIIAAASVQLARGYFEHVWLPTVQPWKPYSAS